MPVNKLQRFAEVAEMDRVLEHTDPCRSNGRWQKDIFQNSNPLVLELGCGKAQTTTSLAERHPSKNFVGIDIKGSRIWKGAKRADKNELGNVRFLRTQIEQLDTYFDEDEVTEIWITFPDPWPRTRDRSKRLTSPRFLHMYKQILHPDGTVHFKTDDDSLFKYSLKTIPDHGGTITKIYEDLYDIEKSEPTLTIQTSFEKKHLAKGKTIKYCAFNWE